MNRDDKNRPERRGLLKGRRAVQRGVCGGYGAVEGNRGSVGDDTWKVQKRRREGGEVYAPQTWEGGAKGHWCVVVFACTI
jgi:hypothetical protein